MSATAALKYWLKSDAVTTYIDIIFPVTALWARVTSDEEISYTICT